MIEKQAETGKIRLALRIIINGKPLMTNHPNKLREAFEQYANRHFWIESQKERCFDLWQAAITHEREHSDRLAEALRRIAYWPLGGDAATYFCGVNMQNIAKEALATHETRKGNQDDKD